MAISRRKHLRQIRRARRRDLKHSGTGWIGTGLALGSLLLFVIAIGKSFAQSGNADYGVGSVGIVGLIIAIGALILGIIAVGQPKVRPIPPRTSIILGLIMTIVYAGLFVFGWL